MGRPRKQTADWFPHYVADSRTKFILEDSWGNDGYAFWFKILELLCRSDGHFYDCSVAANKKYLTAFTKLSEQTIDEIIGTLAELGKLDKELWEKKQIIWCQTLVNNLQILYSKRTVSAPEKPKVGEFSERKEPETQEKAEKTPEAEQPAAEAPPKKKRKTKAEKDAESRAGKKAYAEFVYMTEAEYEKLVEKYGKEATDRMIEKLDNAKGAKGYTYKSDYRAILSWVAKEVVEELEKEKRGGAGGYGFSAGNNAGGFKPSGGFKQQ